MSNVIQEVLESELAFVERRLEEAIPTADRLRAIAVEAKTAAGEADERVVDLRAKRQKLRRDLDSGRLN